MAIDNKLITPKTNQRVINPQLATEGLQKQPKKKVAPNSVGKKSAFKSFLYKFLLFIIISALAVSIVVGVYMFLANSNAWQIEKINNLQKTTSQIKLNISTLEEQVKSFTEPKQLNEQQTQLNNLQAELQVLTAKFSEIAKPQVMAEKQPITVANPELIAEITAINQHLQGLQNKQQSLIEQNELLKSSLLVKKSDFQQSIGSISKLSDQQLQNWVLQINNQWLFSNNNIATLNSLHALSQSVSQSEHVTKARLLAKIKQDLAMIENHQPPVLDITKITELTQWITALNLNSVNEKVDVPHETSPTNWQQVQQEISQLFSIRKQDSKYDLSIVAVQLNENLIKQRMLVQVKQLGWAINSQAPQVVQYAVDDISSLIKRYAPNQFDTWQTKKLSLIPTSKMVKMPLHITEIAYVNND